MSEDIKEEKLMSIGKGMLCTIIVLALFAGPGVIHVAQMLGILKIDISVSPTQFTDPESPVFKKKY